MLQPRCVALGLFLRNGYPVLSNVVWDNQPFPSVHGVKATSKRLLEINMLAAHLVCGHISAAREGL